MCNNYLPHTYESILIKQTSSFQLGLTSTDWIHRKPWKQLLKFNNETANRNLCELSHDQEAHPTTWNPSIDPYNLYDTEHTQHLHNQYTQVHRAWWSHRSLHIERTTYHHWLSLAPTSCVGTDPWLRYYINFWILYNKQLECLIPKTNIACSKKDVCICACVCSTPYIDQYRPCVYASTRQILLQQRYFACMGCLAITNRWSSDPWSLV